MCDNNDDMNAEHLQRLCSELQSSIKTISFTYQDIQNNIGLREKSFVYYTLQKRIEELENEIRELKKEN